MDEEMNSLLTKINFANKVLNYGLVLWNFILLKVK